MWKNEKEMACMFFINVALLPVHLFTEGISVNRRLCS